MARISRITVSPRLFDHLGVSAYNSVRKCLAELCANSYDADATNVHILIPEKVDEKSTIIIQDNGMGMTDEDLEVNYLSIGRDRRREGDYTKGGRAVIGSKGVGKFAGFGIAGRMEVTTWKDGVISKVILDRSSFHDLESLTDREIHIETNRLNDGDITNHGTRIELCSLNEGLELVDVEDLRKHIFRNLPRKPDFLVLVNEIECSAQAESGERIDFSDVIKSAGTVTGYYIVTDTFQESHGLAIRVRGRLVTEPELFGINQSEHNTFKVYQLVGEINADFLDPEQSFSTNSCLINTARDGLLLDSPTVKSLRKWAKEFLDKVFVGIAIKEAMGRTQRVFTVPKLKEKIDSLPPHVRGHAKDVIEAIMPKLNKIQEKEAIDLVEWILKYFESNALHELLRVIIGSNLDEIEKLSLMVQEWGLRQVNDVVEMTKRQIEVIGKLESLVDSRAALEVELHKLIETNLWLVREGLELWSSDKPLKTILEGHIMEEYQNRENLRPDIVCRSRDNGNSAVILEFKKPAERIKMEHVSQALRYVSLLKKYRPSIVFETYIVGKIYDNEVLATKDNLDHAKLHLWSYGEILQNARIRFEKILQVLGR